jgi:hypothetical protein
MNQLSIIIPYYNFIFFEETLASLANQTDKRFKVYIGDDTSPENPNDLLGKYKGQFDFVYHRFEHNMGAITLTKQWERCIALSADEEWIMILGDDDVLGDDVIEEFYKQYNVFESVANVVRYSTIVLDERNKSKSELFQHPQYEKGLDFFIRKLTGGTRCSLSEHIFRRDTFLKHKFISYPSAFYSDDRAWIDFSENKMIYTIIESIIYIRISKFSITGSDTSNALQEAELQFLKYIFFNKFQFFKKSDKLLILNRLENSFYKNKVKFFLSWLFLYLSYIKAFDKVEFIKFNRRLIRKIIY